MNALLNTNVGDLRVSDLDGIMKLITATMPEGFDPDSAAGKQFGARKLRSLQEERAKTRQTR
ncbi:MAG: hypothetical protein U0R19_37545 [Bryobacteraceae bacterium]